MPRRPLEFLNAAAVCLLSATAAAAAAAGALPPWRIVLLRYGLMLIALAAIAAVSRLETKSAAAALFVNFYPMALIPMIYESLGGLIPAVRGGEYDAMLAAADRAIFGTDPTVWLERFVWPPLTDALYISYATYYFFPIVVGAVLWRRSPARAKEFIFCLSLTFFISYAGYFVVPAKGPRIFLAARQSVTLEVTPISKAISQKLNELEHTKDDAYPSGHTMITVFCLITAFRHARKLFWGWLPIASMLVASTIYCRFHYVVDVLAGLSLAFLSVPLGKGLYGRLMKRAGV